jgi:hypothetical protein
MTDPVAEIRSTIEASLAGWLAPGARMLPGTFSATERRWSFEIRFGTEVHGEEISCIGKIPRWSEAPALADVIAAGAQPNVEVEYRTLVAIRRMVAEAGDPGLTAVVPLGMSAACNLIVMEVLAARPLASRRADPRTMRRVGRWLRRFHDEIGGAATGTAAAVRLVARLDSIRPPEPAPPGWREATEGVRADLEELTDRGIRDGDLHGDVNSANVLVDSTGRVALIDPNRRAGVVLEDVAHLIAQLRTSKSRIASGGRVPGRRRMRSLEGALRAGYRIDDPEALEAVVALEILERWALVAARTPAARPAAISGMAGRWFRRELARCRGEW